MSGRYVSQAWGSKVLDLRSRVTFGGLPNWVGGWDVDAFGGGKGMDWLLVVIKFRAVGSILFVVFLMLRGSDGFLQETLKGLLPIGFVSWSFRGGKGSFFIFLINVFHILLLGIGTQGLGHAG